MVGSQNPKLCKHRALLLKTGSFKKTEGRAIKVIFHVQGGGPRTMLSPLGNVEQIPVLSWKADVPSSLEVSPIIHCQPRVWEQVTAREAPRGASPGHRQKSPRYPPGVATLLHCGLFTSPQTVFLLGLFAPPLGPLFRRLLNIQLSQALSVRSPDFPWQVSLPLGLLWVGQLGVEARCRGWEVRGLDASVALRLPRWEALATLFDLSGPEFPYLCS